MLFSLLQLQLFSRVDNTIEGLGHQGAQVKRELAEQKRAPTGQGGPPQKLGLKILNFLIPNLATRS
jgi:hypothetical protein